CQIGVKTEKITISKEIRYSKPLILKGLQKNSKNISTHPLTVLTLRAIVQIEQRKRRKGTGNKKKRFPKIQNLLSPDKRNEK
ncbi:hypothetical protein, partial [Hominisplanchenecus sp.]|uniref:hypothetical protein n=1 Tax=Hominisplanchenecus sp. TaxID=3038130 RepID=UPI003994F609